MTKRKDAPVEMTKRKDTSVEMTKRKDTSVEMTKGLYNICRPFDTFCRVEQVVIAEHSG